MKLFIQLTALLTFALASAFTLPAPTGYKVGDKATDFKLKNVDGKMVGLSDFKDAQGYIVVFTCNTCPFAVKYEDRLIDLHNKFASKGFPVIAINPNNPALQAGDSFDKMQARATDKKFPFPYLFDDGQKIFPEYGATRTPHVFILDKNKVVKYIGAIDDNADDAAAVQIKYVEDAVASIKAGKEVNPKETKAIGCTIKA